MNDRVKAFEDAGQGFTTRTASDGTVLTYEHSRTALGVVGLVLVKGRWVHCPSASLMHPQAEINGIKRGDRMTWETIPCTVLSVYMCYGTARACIMRDNRTIDTDREDVPLSVLKRP